MLSTKQLKFGDLDVAMIDFEFVGDVLPKHHHLEDSVHITIVAKGKLKAYSHDWEIEAGPGQLVDFRPNEPHELMAMEDGTRIFNIQKNYLFNKTT